MKRRISTVAFAFHAKVGSAATVLGRAQARFVGGKNRLRLVPARGYVQVRSGQDVRLLLRATGLRLERLSGPIRARLILRVAGTHGLSRCRLGSRATAELFRSTDLRQDDSNDASVRLSLPRDCGGTIRRAAAISVSDS